GACAVQGRAVLHRAAAGGRVAGRHGLPRHAHPGRPAAHRPLHARLAGRAAREPRARRLHHQRGTQLPARGVILIPDFRSPSTPLIARRAREFHVYSEIHPFDMGLDVIRRLEPEGIILSGGPASIYEDDAPTPRPEVLDLLRGGSPPVLGICYGMNVVNLAFGGGADRAAHKEFGPADVRITRMDPLLSIGGRSTRVWMSHGDRLTRLGADLDPLA